MTFRGRRLSVENLWWKTTFSGRRPSVEDNLWWKTTFGGRRPLVEDNLWWKTTFSGRQPSVEDDLCWKTTYCGRLPAVEDDLQWKTTFVGYLHAAYSALRHLLLTLLLSYSTHPIAKIFYSPCWYTMLLTLLLSYSASPIGKLCYPYSILLHYPQTILLAQLVNYRVFKKKHYNVCLFNISKTNKPISKPFFLLKTEINK